MSHNFFSKALDDLIYMALTEDIGQGDITTQSTVPETAMARAHLVAKEDGVLCGCEVFERVFHVLDNRIVLRFLAEEGALIAKKQILCELEGPARSLLTGERVALNLLQHMSGIATATNRAVSQISGFPCKIIDTRKTTPGLRVLEKYAVRTGGGANHRFHLADGVLIKDNHIKAAGSIIAAVQAAKSRVSHMVKIEVEVETLSQVEEALHAGADVLLLDNMSIDVMKEAVTLVKGRALTEASGNMGEKDLNAVAATGVNLISIGALTHSVKALDLSIRFL